MIKKLMFLSLGLALTFSTPAQAQQAPTLQDTIEQLSTQDINTLTEAIKELPEKEQAVLGQALSEKNNSHLIGTTLGITGLVLLAITGCVYFNKACNNMYKKTDMNLNMYGGEYEHDATEL